MAPRESQPCSQDLFSPHPKGSKGRKTLVGVVTCLGDNFIFMGIPIYQDIVAASVCHT